jgi:hypothetical protein
VVQPEIEKSAPEFLFRNISDYTVERDSANAGYQPIATGITALSYVDTQMVDLTDYGYRVIITYVDPDKTAVSNEFTVFADFSGPEFIHTPPPDTNTPGTFVTYADLDDDSGVFTDSIYYWISGTTDTTIATHDSITGGNRYWYHITVAVNDTVQYFFVAYDNSLWGNRGESIIYSFRTDVGIAEGGEEPISFFLAGVNPNPSHNRVVQFAFGIPTTSKVSLAIYNVVGQRVKTLVAEEMAPGRYSVQWDGRDDLGRKAASGIYMYQLKAGDNEATKKFILIK